MRQSVISRPVTALIPPVALRRNPQLRDQPRQRIPPLKRQKNRRQIQSIVSRIRQGQPMRLQKPQIKPNAMRHDGINPDKPRQLLPHLRKRRRPPYILRRDPGISLHKLRDFPPRIHESLKRVQHLIAPETHRPHFQNRIAIRPQPRSLQVDRYANLFQRGNQLSRRNHHAPNIPRQNSTRLRR